MRVGIVGYGRLGESCERLILNDERHTLVGIFTRRLENTVKASTKRVYSLDKISAFASDVDALLLCIGSKNDAFNISLSLAGRFNTIDCFDTHARSCEYLTFMNKYAMEGAHSSICMCGWDPGLLSQIRVLFSSIFSFESTYTYWGRGVSQGHSEAIRTIHGVKRAVCYTVPDENTVRLARMGILFNKENLHRRECYVVAEENRAQIEEKIKNIPHYFKGTKTDVFFISEREFLLNHSKIYHKGRVIAADKEGLLSELTLKIPSNPDFTAKIMLSYLTALDRLTNEGSYGAKTPLDIPLSYLVDDIYTYI